MAPYVRILDLATKRYLKPHRAAGLIAAGACVWVEQGVSVRTLTLAEMVERRAELSAASEPPPQFELPGVVTVGIAKMPEEYDVAAQGTHMLRAGVWIGPWLKPAALVRREVLA